MNTKEILEMATRIQEIKTKIERLESVMGKTWRISFSDGYSSKIWETTNEDIVEEIKKPLRKILVDERNKLHKMNGEPLEEIQEQKTNYEKFDIILKDINEDEYKNREDKGELLRDYLEDYKKIRKLVEDYYDDIEMLRCKGDDTKDATFNYHRNIKILFEDIKKVYDKENDLLAFYDDLHDEVKSAIRDIDKRLESIDEEVDKITGYVDNNR